MADFKPMNESYWVEPGRLLAGEHPGHWDETVLRRRVASLLDAGIRVFVDLTESWEEAPAYRPMLEKVCRDRGIHARYLAHPLRKNAVPERAEVVAAVLEDIRTEVDAGERVFVHCGGGVGRTGLVMGCWLVERGFDPEHALDELARRFAAMNKARVYRVTPANYLQTEWVENWAPRLDMRNARRHAS